MTDHIHVLAGIFLFACEQDKQLTFLKKYSSSFDDTEMLEKALQAWEKGAALIQLREMTLRKLELLEKGSWLQLFEIFTEEQQEELRNKGAWVVVPQHLHVEASSKAGRQIRAEDLSVGRAPVEKGNDAREIEEMRRKREKTRKEIVLWLRRVASKITGKTLAHLREVDSAFGDVVSFQGKGYAGVIAASLAKAKFRRRKP